MRRRSSLLAGVIALAGALAFSHDASAQTCDADHTITWPAVNPLWQICWVSPANSSGIDGSAVEITSAYYNGKLVIARGNVPVINVKYDPGGCGGSTLSYRDWGHEEVPFEVNNVIRPGYAEPTIPPVTTCDTGTEIGTFKGVAVQKLPDRLTILSQIQAGWYRYIPTWTFYLDGTFQPGFDFTAIANTCTQLPHYHNAYWRMDFDVDGTGNDVIDEFNSGTWNTLATEAQRLHSPTTNRKWRVRDRATGRGFELVPEIDVDVAGSFSGADFFALAYRNTELDDGGATSGLDAHKEHIDRYLTNESINGADVVLWYREGFRHDGPVSRHCHAAGPLLRPFETPLPEITISNVSIPEGNSGTSNATFAVRLPAPATGVVTVSYTTANGSAAAGSDYTATSGTLTFNPGQVVQNITVPIRGDTAVEPTETFVVNLTTAVGGFIGDGVGEGTIVTDDSTGGGGAGLIAAYGLNEGTGTTAGDAAGHTGTISGATWTTGKFGGALQFDGVNDMVTIADAPDLHLSTGMTVEAWVYPTALTGWMTVALKEGGATGLAYGLYAHDAAPRQAGYINTGGADVNVRSSSALPLNTWSHLALTYDGAMLRLYRDGAQVGARTVTGAMVATAGPLRLGGNTIWAEWFVGKIDEVRVYDWALSASQIVTDMNTPIGGGPPPPMDTTPPSAAITAPANNAFVTGTVTVTATASDNVAVASVQFLLDGQPLGSPDTTAPYSTTWNTTASTAGSHALTARAVDTSGNSGTSAAITARVDNTAPTAAITSPAAGSTVSGTVTVTANASDANGVTSVQFLLDGQPLGSADTTAPYSTTWNTTTSAAGSHALTAQAVDAAGNSGTSAPTNVTISGAAPVVALTSPAAGALVSGTVTVTATASDSSGIASVQFLLDGQPLGSPDTTAPYSTAWNTTTSTAGPHALTARAVDATGTPGTSAPVNVTVDNTAPVVAITSPAAGSTVSGTVTVSATSSDAGGVASVQFKVDGANLGAPDTTSPFSASWTTTPFSNDQHTLTAVATDVAGWQTTSAAVAVTVSNGGGGWVPPSGLVAAYTFSEGTGTTTADLSGSGNTGTISGAAWTTGGRFGNALSFDGVNDWVTIADAASVDLTSGMTIEAWVYPTALSGWRTVVLKEATSPNGLAYSLYANDNVPTRPAGYVNRGAGGDVPVRGVVPLVLNTWSHLAVTYGGGSFRLYVNGTQVGTVALTGNIRTSTGALRIGGNSVWQEWFAGRIDEVRIYNRALTAAEISAGMNQTLRP
jgi:hypothetical protein